jgi:hypothetical protein
MQLGSRSFGAKIEHARELIDQGEARHPVADLFTVDRVTLYGALVV